MTSIMIATVGITLMLTVGARILPLDRVTAPTAIVIWCCVLAIGAITDVLVAALAIVYLPETGLYSFIASFCVHVTVPVISPHVGFSGHTALHAVMALPVLGLFTSTVWLVSRITNGWWTLRSRLQDSVETDDGWALIQDERIVLGVAPLGRGRIVVSDATLKAMDPAELEAGLNHEVGHIRRRHRSIMLVSRVLAALAFAFPGTRQAQRNLFQALERDADEYAVRQTRDPLSLASAICKAATGPSSAGGIGLAGGKISRRLDYLEGHLTLVGPAVRRTMHALTMFFVAVTFVFAVSTSAWAVQVAPSGNHSWSIGKVDC